MLVGAFVPYSEKDLQLPLLVFPIEDVGTFLTGAYEYESNKPELLAVFEVEDAKTAPCFAMSKRYEVESIPENTFYLQLGEILDGTAFICNPDQTEALPEEQAEKRRKMKQYVKGHIKEDRDYFAFLKAQKTAFVMYMLPLWAPFIISRFSGVSGEISLDSELSETDKIKVDGLIANGYIAKAEAYLLNGYFGKFLSANDKCWCGSGLKYKKCHLRNILQE